MSSTDRPIPGTGTTTTSPPTPAGGPPLASPPPQPVETSTTDEVKQTAGHGVEATKEVAGHARSEVEDATSHAAEQAKHVVDTARAEVRDVVDEARDAVRQQADRQSHVAAEAIGRLRDDLRAMKSGDTPREGTAEYLERAASSLDTFVDRLERDGIEGALSGLRTFARKTPGGFLLASAGVGFALGRLLRNADHPQQVDEEQPARGDHERQLTGQQAIDLTTDGPGRFAGDRRPEPVASGAGTPTWGEGMQR